MKPYHITSIAGNVPRIQTSVGGPKMFSFLHGFALILNSNGHVPCHMII